MRGTVRIRLGPEGPHVCPPSGGYRSFRYPPFQEESEKVAQATTDRKGTGSIPGEMNRAREALTILPQPTADELADAEAVTGQGVFPDAAGNDALPPGHRDSLQEFARMEISAPLFPKEKETEIFSLGQNASRRS